MCVTDTIALLLWLDIAVAVGEVEMIVGHSFRNIVSVYHHLLLVIRVQDINTY